jgi:hypothetical protein
MGIGRIGIDVKPVGCYTDDNSILIAVGNISIFIHKLI